MNYGSPALTLLSWWTDPLLIGAAMPPHEGFGQEQAHESLSTGVLTHTITFHDESDDSQWHLFANESIHPGHGRTYDRGNVFGPDGRLVASFAPREHDPPVPRRRPEARHRRTIKATCRSITGKYRTSNLLLRSIS
jgi:hypothetical protein